MIIVTSEQLENYFQYLLSYSSLSKGCMQLYSNEGFSLSNHSLISSLQGPLGPQGPIGYPGPRGVKVRVQLH